MLTDNLITFCGYLEPKKASKNIVEFTFIMLLDNQKILVDNFNSSGGHPVDNLKFSLILIADNTV